MKNNELKNDYKKQEQESAFEWELDACPAHQERE
jgi:hypothetical protein